MRATPLLTSLTAALLCTACTPDVVRDNPATGPAPDPRIVEKLQQIVEIRQRMLDFESLRADAGRPDATGTAQVELTEALIDLSLARHRHHETLMQLTNLVAAHQARLQLAEKRSTDRGTRRESDEIRIDLLHAEIRLAREQARATP
ncbi:MAG: hypothetical protein KF833_12340 [Verrucomicrobiae bacterium]|nr:hypothetical protein [Verrucomicrobiae bacterium]